MIALTYTLTSYHYFLNQLAGLLGTKPQQGKVTIPAHYGNGYYKLIQFSEELEALIYDFYFRDEFVLNREKNDEEYYILIFDETAITGTAKVSIDKDKQTGAEGRNTALYLTSFLYDVVSVLEKEAPLKGVRIRLTVNWMRKYLQAEKNESVLEQYISLKNSGIWHMPVNAELRELLHELITEEDKPLLFYQNKILAIVERFFGWLYSQMQSFQHLSGINRTDIEQAQKVEAILTNDVTAIPPTINELAKTVAMSASKLKKIFKTVYGVPPYEYYQKQRMQKARVMLLSGNYSVKDVGYTLGYANLSNFTLAFKKAFGVLPSSIAKA